MGERIQFAMLQVQNLNNVWRKSAFRQLMGVFEVITSAEIKSTVKVFKEPIAFVVPPCVPQPRSVQDVVGDRISSMQAYVQDADKPIIEEVKENVRIIAEMGDDKEKESGLDTEQER